jgi:hypothetical protein
MAYGLLVNEPVHQKLGWLDNPKNIGLLSAALGILANNKGNYGAFGPAVGAGGLLGLQASMQTQQQNVFNRRNEQRDSRGDYFNRNELDLRRKQLALAERELGWKEGEAGAERDASGLIGNLFGGGAGDGGGSGGNVAQIFPQQAAAPQGVPNFSTPQAVKMPWSEANLANMQQAQQPQATQIPQGPTEITAPTNEVVGGSPWEAVDSQITALQEIGTQKLKNGQRVSSTKAYKDEYARLRMDRDFLSKQREVKPLPGVEGVFYQEGKDGFFEQVDNGMGGTKRRYMTTAELQKLGIKKSATDKRPTLANAIRQDFLTVSKSFKDVNEGYSRIVESAKNPSAAGDLSMVFSYMKILDPTSVVREGEQATAANARGVPETIRTIYNRVMSGEKLGDDQRADFLNRAGMLYGTALQQQQSIEKQFEAMAKRQMIDPDDVVVRYRAGGAKSDVINYDAQGNRIGR